MRELQKRQQFKKRIYSLPVLAILLVLTVLIVRGTYNVYQKKAASAADVAALETKADELQRQNEELSSDMAAIETSAGVEKLVKERFNVTAEGEHEVILVDGPAASSTASAPPPWYKQLWSDILGVF